MGESSRLARVAQVVPLTNTRALRGSFDYSLGAAMAERVQVGSLLLVPFAGRQLEAVVVGLAQESELAADRLRAPRAVLEESLPQALVELAAWVAREYCSTQARALSLMLPVGARRGMRPRLRWVAELTGEGRRLLEGRGGAAPRRGGRGAPTQRQLIALSALRGGPARASVVPGGVTTLRALERRGLVGLERREHGRRPRHLVVGARAPEPLALTPEQERAHREIERALRERRAEQLLVHGVTGSGKTEIYLRAAAHALAQGRGAIVLVPEIALTPQMVGRVVARLGETVAVLHSRLSMGERYDEWRRLREGRARVCVGPRSAVFAPIENLGLMVVDEEQEASYKHEGDPRYDARRVAAERARAEGALLLLGSATPRPESYATARRLRLLRRVDGAPLPDVDVLDMRTGADGLHRRTVEALAELRDAGGKGIVLLNRRGWSAFLSCRGCGRVWGCPNCDVSLVLHRAPGTGLRCHHCGYAEALPQRCPCGSGSLARHGRGTERLERELAQLMGSEPLPVFRLDADVTGRGGRSGHTVAADVLARFERAPAGVLLGTQMVAKGHDFPGVSLGVVLDAEATLAFPDFRAEERTFALIAQLAGRVGRGGAGRVLVQTIVPQARAIAHAARHDSEGFLRGELERRRALAYPPFAELLRVVCASEAPGRAAPAAASVRAHLDEELARCGASATVLGPADLFRRRGQERSALLLKTATRSSAVQAVGRALRATVAGRRHVGVSFSVDVDPH